MFGCDKFLHSYYFSKMFDASCHRVLENGALSLNPSIQPARVADMLDPSTESPQVARAGAGTSLYMLINMFRLMKYLLQRLVFFERGYHCQKIINLLSKYLKLSIR